MKVNRRTVLFAIAAALAIAALMIAQLDNHESLSAREFRLADRIACPVCGGESAAQSNAAVSRQIRSEIASMIRAGKSDDAILSTVMARYPNSSLLPESSGIGLVAWLVPIGVLAIGGMGLFFAFARWRREPRLVANADDEAVVRNARREGVHDARRSAS